mgnify:CR=1 FL=1
MEAIPLPDPELADDAVVLGPFAEADIDQLAEICVDPEIARYTFIPTPYLRHHAVDFVRNQERRRRTWESIDLAIRDRDSGALLGSTGMRVFDLRRGSCEIGYWVAPQARGQGVAPRAVQLLSGWAIGTLPVTMVELTADEPNAASRRVAEKAGFKPTSEVRERHAKGRAWRLVVYSLNGA